MVVDDEFQSLTGYAVDRNRRACIEHTYEMGALTRPTDDVY